MEYKDYGQFDFEDHEVDEAEERYEKQNAELDKLKFMENEKLGC